MPTVYPIVPGYEIVGCVTEVGSAVTTFKPRDLTAVGCLINLGDTCLQSQAGREQAWPNPTLTFNVPDKYPRRGHLRRAADAPRDLCLRPDYVQSKPVGLRHRHR